jgi:hypothetical protein
LREDIIVSDIANRQLDHPRESEEGKEEKLKHPWRRIFLAALALKISKAFHPQIFGSVTNCTLGITVMRHRLENSLMNRHKQQELC